MKNLLIKNITLIIFLIIPLVTKTQDYCKFIHQIQNYQNSVKLKNSGDFDIIDPNTFDFNTYLSFYNEIEVENDIQIGVYYFDNFLDGKPYLYALRKNQKLNEDDKNFLYDFLNKTENRARNHIVPTDSYCGFLQYLFFSELGEQFALKWHANYKQKYIICSHQEISVIVNEFKEYIEEDNNNDDEEKVLPLFSVDLDELNMFAQINPIIKVELKDEYCTITWIENRTHSGIYSVKYIIQRQQPYGIEKVSEELLLKILMGFIY
ncbi:MAG: hypothetical protein PF694_15700 [Bacteroidetes bacterium]|jgi:hypothetical protein|nr:hypothetical protein [Bacteroidota bacterium]